jgi:hypothetical protein
LLMIFLLQFEFWFGHEKTRWLSCRRAGAILFDLSGRLAQAMEVRRHGCPMMMMVTVMAMDLHLFQR